MKNNDIFYREFNLNPGLVNLGLKVQERIKNGFDRIDNTREINQVKVIRAMQKHRVSDTHFLGTTGYGYNDRGREVLDGVFADVFGTEDALVRHNITCGTHALALCLYGILRPGDELLSITGKPYDTLEEVIGLRGDRNTGSLHEYGITYRQVDLKENDCLDYQRIKESINDRTRLVFIQRSRGYAWRGPVTVEVINEAVKFVKSIKENILVMVDNCYGEFVEVMEPTEVGVDIIAGSLIKNPGGGLVPSGGYIAGKKDLVEQISYRLTVPGLGREVGATLGHNRLLFQGLFLAPHIVSESLKGAVFCAEIMKELGFQTCPDTYSMRSDIIQAVRFNSAKEVIAFCQGIQKGSPVDSFVTPQPWDMPGYDSPVIMAAGAFIQGSSIELSADAPIREPYTAYLQGGLVYDHVKLGVLCALQNMIDEGLLTILL